MTLRQRDPRQRDKAHLGFVAKLPCIAHAMRGVEVRPVEVAHIKIGFPEAGWRAFGHSERSHDWRTAPICPACHRTGKHAQHRNPFGDERAWWAHFGVYPPAFCAALVAAREAGEDGLKVIREAARGAFPFPDA